MTKAERGEENWSNHSATGYERRQSGELGFEGAKAGQLPESTPC